MKTQPILTAITIPAAAKKLKCTPAALYGAANRGALKTATMLGRVVVELDELARYQRDTKIGRPPNGKKPNGKNGKGK